MKAKKILLSLLCVGAILGTASCKQNTQKPVTPSEEASEEVKTPAEKTEVVTPTQPEQTLVPTEPAVTPTQPGEVTPTQPATPEVVGYTATLVYNNGDQNSTIESVEDNELYYFDKPTDPKKAYHKFAGWYTDEALTQPFNFNSPVNSDLTLYAKWAQAYDTVNTIWDLKTAAESITANPSGNVVVPGDGTVTYQNRFSVEANGKSRFEIGSKDAFNTQGTTVIVHLSAAGNTNGLTVTYKWASSDPGNFVIRNITTGEEVINNVDDKSEQTVTLSNLAAGDYEIVGVISETKNASLRIYGLAVTEQLPQGPTTGISVSATNAQTDFLMGREFNAKDLNVVLEYENGRQDVLDAEKYTVSAVDMTTPGIKTVTITYQLNATTTYTDTYDVVVWEAKSLNVYTYTYNGVTNHARYVYFDNETTKSTDNITVKALCEAPGVDGTHEFKLAANEYTVDTTNTNKIEFTYGDLDVAFDYVTVNSIDLSSAEFVIVSVDPTRDVSVSETESNFHTIMQAMQFLELAKVSDNAKKCVVLVDGATYKEKVEITLPNVILSTVSGLLGYEPTENAVIEYGLLAGDVEPGESRIYSTDGSASVSIRKTAENFQATYISFVNSTDTYAEYEVAKTKTNDTQGVAVLVQADKSAFGRCEFYGYQDTLYAQVGRQYYLECYIEGHTDYIFGYDATAYFDQCTINSIGAGVENNNGGYVVATKGNTTTPIEFGYVFDNCKFTADENTMLGSVSLARGWDKDMTMAVINSEISGHYSVEAYGYVTPDNPETEAVEKNLNDRYGKMNAAPVASKLVEYNNTGAGAITESLVDTCTVLTADEAAKYTFMNIFTPYNGGTKYADVWALIGSKDASFVVMDNEGNKLGDLTNVAFNGSYIFENELLELVTPLIPTTKRIAGIYTDAACTVEFDYKAKLSASNTIYVKVESALDYTPFTAKLYASSSAAELTFAANTDTKWDDVITFHSGSKAWSVEGNNRTIYDVDGSVIASTHRIKANGKNTFSIDLSAYGGKVKISFYALTGSNSDLTRSFTVVDAEANELQTFVCNLSGEDASLKEGPISSQQFALTVDCGKKYTINTSAAINFYGIVIEPVFE